MLTTEVGITNFQLFKYSNFCFVGFCRVGFCRVGFCRRGVLLRGVLPPWGFVAWGFVGIPTVLHSTPRFQQFFKMAAADQKLFFTTVSGVVDVFSRCMATV